MNTFLATLLLALPTPEPSQTSNDAVLAKRAQEVAALVAAAPKWADDLFDAAFLKAVPPEQLKTLCSGIFGKLGAIASMPRSESMTALSAKYEAIFADGSVMPVTLGLSSAQPHSIVTLWFGAPAPGIADLPAAIEALKSLPGQVSFGLYELTADALVPMAELEPDRALAIGSAFKLYVLGTLVGEISLGKRKPEGIVRIENRYCSMPSGKLQTWPRGTPLTLYSLATFMISESDNTATDHLLFALGRERVESMLGEMGNSVVERNVPFLSTGEMFRLKLTTKGLLADKYLKMDAAQRRVYLEGILVETPLSEDSIDSALLSKPSHTDTIEWFASARDLCRAMDWLRKATEPGKTANLRQILVVNPGLDVSKKSFEFIGYKGGSETGVLNLTYLLRSRDTGDWYALSCGWNDPEAALDETKLLGIVTRTLSVLGKLCEKKAEEARQK